MSNMIERVARAMYDVTPFKNAEGCYDEQSETYRRMCELLARTAIMTMREPTDKMIVRGEDTVWDIDGDYVTSEAVGAAYAAMIDEALNHE